LSNEKIGKCLKNRNKKTAPPSAARPVAVAVAHASDAASPAPSGALVDPKLLQLMQGVASGQVSPEDAARRMCELSAGY